MLTVFVAAPIRKLWSYSDKVLQVVDVEMYGKRIPANINITLRHFKNMKASQPALFFYYCQWEKPYVCSFDDTKLWVITFF
jgi:hypothetical protein